MSTPLRPPPNVWRLPLLTLAATLTLLLIAAADTVTSMVTVWHAATTYHHCFLVLPIAAFLIWTKRTRLAALTPRQAPLALLPLLAFAFLWLIGRAAHLQLFEHVALVGMAIFVVTALLGWQIARILAFPLAFLAFLVPFGDVFVPALQQFTASFSVALLRLTGIPVFHDGIMIETPSGLFEVAEACAGIRFLIANVMIGTLFAYLSMTRLWKWALFLALAVIIPIIANGLRAFGIMVIAHLTDNAYAAGVDHLVYGWGFFAVVMLLFLAIGNALADWSSPTGDSVDGSPAGNGADGSPTGDGVDGSPTGDGVDGFAGVSDGRAWHPAFVLPVALLILAAPLYAGAVLDRPGNTVALDPKKIQNFALDLGPVCKTAPAGSDGWRPRFDRADVTQGLIIDCGGEPVDLFLAYYIQERDGAELIHHDNRLADGERWTRLRASWHDPDVDGLPRKLRAEELFGRQTDDRLVLAWYWLGGRLLAEDWRAKAYQLYRRLLGDDGPVALIALSAPFDDRPDEALSDIEAVLARHKGIADYLADMAPPK